MPVPLLVAAGLAALGKGIGSVFSNKAKNKRAQEAYRATVAQRQLDQKKAEDKRIAALDTTASLLGRTPATTAGGNVHTNVALDPALVASLRQPREYDEASAVPKPVGGTYDLLAGLFDTAGDTAAYLPTGPAAASKGVGSLLAPGANVAPQNPDWITPKPITTLDDLLALSRSGGQ